jgi:hypothetical protein
MNECCKELNAKILDLEDKNQILMYYTDPNENNAIAQLQKDLNEARLNYKFLKRYADEMDYERSKCSCICSCDRLTNGD